MKKISVCFVGVLAALSLAACAPTKPSNMTSTAAPVETMETKDGRAEKVPDPDAPVLEMVSVYSVEEGGTGLTLNLEGIENTDAQSLVDLLIQAGVLEEGTAVSFYGEEGGEKAGPGVEVEATEGGERIGTLELSKTDVSDAAVVAAIGNTFIENFELDKLKLTVDGKSVSQGDGEYLTYISDYKKLK